MKYEVEGKAIRRDTLYANDPHQAAQLFEEASGLRCELVREVGGAEREVYAHCDGCGVVIFDGEQYTTEADGGYFCTRCVEVPAKEATCTPISSSVPWRARW